jgi:tetratricopeptide (TPR) repeat protein
MMDIYKTLGDMFGQANQPKSALGHYGLALEFSRGLVKEVPLARQTTTKEYSHSLARLCLAVGALYRERGRHADALRMLREALGPEGIGEWLSHFPPRTPGMKSGVNVANPFKTEARVQLEHARIHLEEGRYAEALSLVDPLVAFFRPIADELELKDAAAQVARDPGGEYTADVFSLAGALLGRALALEGLGRGAKAEESFAEGIRRLEGFDLSGLRLLLAEFFARRGLARAADPARRSGAVADLDRSLAVMDRLMRDLGETVPRLRVRAGALLARGMLRAGDGPSRRDDAAADLRATRAILEPIVAKSEGQPAVNDLLDLAEALARLAALAREHGDAREARALFESAAARVKEALAVCPAHADALRARAKIEADLRTPAP